MDKEIKLVGAPSWYGTALEQLDFEWSREEELELERYCQRILKNIANEAGPGLPIGSKSIRQVIAICSSPIAVIGLIN